MKRYQQDFEVQCECNQQMVVCTNWHWASFAYGELPTFSTVRTDLGMCRCACESSQIKDSWEDYLIAFTASAFGWPLLSGSS